MLRTQMPKFNYPLTVVFVIPGKCSSVFTPKEKLNRAKALHTAAQLRVYDVEIYHKNLCIIPQLVI